MKNKLLRFRNWILLLSFCLLCLEGINNTYAQDVKWLRVTSLQEPVNSIGASFENEYSFNQNTNFFTWPAQYGVGLNDQNTLRMEGIWIGCQNFDDPVAGKVLSYKVIGSGPRSDANIYDQIFPVELKLIAKEEHPVVIVDGAKASLLDTYDLPDSIAPDMAPDRMVVVKFNTSMGITVTKKVMAFANSQDGDYFIYDWVFENTGIYNAQGSVKQQTLDNVWFCFNFRYAFAGESYQAASEPINNWAYFNATWGLNTINHDFGDYGSWSEFDNSSSTLYQMRGFYAFAGPEKRTGVSYAEDWGCPAQTYDGRLGQWKYGGSVTLHADKSASDQSDDPSQPKTTWFISSDIPIMQAVNQYDPVGMLDRWTAMTEGHPPQPHDVVVGDDYPENYSDPRRQAGGGTMQDQGFGPYTLAPGDSVHIVYAQGVKGISREKNLEVGANWLKYFNKSGTPDLIMPNGSAAAKTLDGANAYKKAWVATGRDSLIQTFRRAIDNYNSGYNVSEPPAPDQFTVQSGGNKIALSWSDNADGYAHFNGYVIYRSEGSVMDPMSKYEKIFECDKSNVAHSFDDLTAVRGFDYYYYIQTKDDGTQNTVHPGVPIYSSLFLTITNTAAHLQRPAIPSTPLPFGFPTTKWVIMDDLGIWSEGTSYVSGDSATDAVNYGGALYICLKDDSASTVAPDMADSVWHIVTARGAWASGVQYYQYDYVTVNGVNLYTPFEISGGQSLDLVRVVPNPYDIRSRTFQFGDSPIQQDRIAFYGLPAVCKLKIFTERGDLIYSINHTNGTGDELWNSTTSSGQVVASGIYILYVETPEGQSVIRKFVIIR
jgi:hypothetical protein